MRKVEIQGLVEFSITVFQHLFFVLLVVHYGLQVVVDVISNFALVNGERFFIKAYKRN
jgi:hypothetical protein